MVESAVRAFILSFFIVVAVLVVAILTISITATSAVAMLVINLCGGEVTYAVCVLASSASHVVLIGGYFGLAWLEMQLNNRRLSPE